MVELYVKQSWHSSKVTRTPNWVILSLHRKINPELQKPVPSQEEVPPGQDSYPTVPGSISKQTSSDTVPWNSLKYPTTQQLSNWHWGKGCVYVFSMCNSVHEGWRSTAGNFLLPPYFLRPSLTEPDTLGIHLSLTPSAGVTDMHLHALFVMWVIGPHDCVSCTLPTESSPKFPK